MLSQAGVPFAERDLIREPLSDAEIRSLLGGRPASILYARRARRNRELGLDPDRLSDEELIAWMAREPTLIRRPTLAVDGELIPGPSQEKLAEVIRAVT